MEGGGEGDEEEPDPEEEVELLVDHIVGEDTDRVHRAGATTSPKLAMWN